MLPFLALTLLIAVGDPCSSELPGNMPDIDQVRRAANNVDGSPVTGLDNDGYGYCAPTTTLDVFVYLANNGYPSLPPGPGPYIGGGNPQYNTFTSYLWSLGFGMSTDPATGTNNGPWSNSVNGIINTAGLSGSILTANIYTDSNSAPTLADIKATLGLGWPTIVACGWYVPARGQYERESGHVFVARRVTDFCTPGQHKLGIRDPATDNNLDADHDGHPDGDAFRQSLPSTETYLTNPNTQTFALGNTTYTGPLEYMSGYTFDGLPAGTRAYIDTLRIFIPAFGLSPCCSDISIGVTQPDPAGGPPTITSFTLPPGRPIIDLAPAARRHRMFAIVDRTTAAQPRTLWQIDRESGATVQIPTPNSLQRLCTGRDDSSLYTLGDDGLIYILRATPPITPLTAPAPVAAITFDHARNELVALSSTARRIFRFSADTLALVSNQLLPSSLPLATAGPAPRITICPVGAYIWLAGGLNRIDGLNGSGAVLSTAATINLTAPALGVDADDRGHVFASASGAIHEFAPPTVTGNPWAPITGAAAKWATMPAPGGVFHIARSITNFTPGIHDQAVFTRHQLPTSFTASIADCPPDVNNSGTVTVQDIFDFLAFYFSADNRADFNHSGALTVQDLFDFLTAYFSGC
jgi:hypothetical protein